MIKPQLIAFGFGLVAGLLGISESARAMGFYGYSLSINDPVLRADFGIHNVPDFRLEKLSTNGAQIVDFNLTIGNPMYNYDFVTLQSAFNDPSNDLTFTLHTPEPGNDGTDSEEIDYDFIGFDPGDIFQFEADVDPDGTQIVHDYRESLFPNAVLTVGFSNGQTLSQTLNPENTNLSGYTFVQTKNTIPEPGMSLALLGSWLGWNLYNKRSRRKPNKN